MTVPTTERLEASAKRVPHVCPADHAHGENSTCRSLHHCKCDECTRYAREYEFWRAAQKRRGKPLLIDGIGIRRRIRALNRLGYSQSVLAEECGMSEAWIGGIMRSPRVSLATAERVRVLYDRLCMTPPAGRTPTERASALRARRYAERMDWPPPLAYDEDRIDDPKYKPEGWVRGGE